MITITKDNSFEEQIENKDAIVVFSADWCPDCVVIKPILPEIEQKYSQFTFLYVDRDEHLSLCEEYAIFGIPSFIAFSNGQEIGRYVNKERKTKEQIEGFIEEIIGKLS
ncbi:thiol reductase thioredoxin [Lottiidibacillus patelloidae]|uniref:Thiol reductase thioredoxin n=1 Tax=Lottiidibacillus patelloidae TaxID=2670334 RepID=A0A263BQW9_9BACI|nr:thioredoxin family protein [Lottiidibacillus patelloidae]OZM56083.1 thiol reductase thioredoxin [Lottiidibacillus patelloidae]